MDIANEMMFAVRIGFRAVGNIMFTGYIMICLNRE